MNPMEVDDPTISLNPEDAELVANLIGATANQLHKVDKETISPSANTKGLQFNPKQLLKKTLESVRRPSSPTPFNQPAFVPVQQVHFPAEEKVCVPQMTVQSSVQQAPQMIPQVTNAPPQVVIMDTQTVQQFRDAILGLSQRMDELTDHVALLHSLEEKFMEMMDRRLKTGVASITLKLNDPPVKKQKELHQQLSGPDQQA